MTIKLIVGLGNPGAEYARTRHNVGIWFIDAVANAWQAQFKAEKKFFSDVAKANIDGHDCYLLKPMTFMNDSGKAVLAACQFYKIDPSEMLIAHDELDFPAGEARIKQNGGHGGHNGLRDIIEKLGGAHNFLRFRIGIAHPGQKEHVTSHVLGAPSKQDKALIDDAIIDGLRILPDLVNGQTEKAIRDLH